MGSLERLTGCISGTGAWKLQLHQARPDSLILFTALRAAEIAVSMLSVYRLSYWYPHFLSDIALAIRVGVARAMASSLLRVTVFGTLLALEAESGIVGAVK